MKKGFFMAFFMLLFVFAWAPSASAAGGGYVQIDGEGLIEASPYGIIDDNGKLTTVGATADNYNAYYNAAAGILYLRDFHLKATDYGGIETNANYLTIDLEGDNSIELSGNAKQGIYPRGSQYSYFTFEGDGNLTIDGQAITAAGGSGIESYDDLIFQGTGKISVIGSFINGVYAYNNIEITSGELEISQTEHGVWSDVEKISISGGTKVTVEADKTGLNAKEITIKDNADVTIKTNSEGIHARNADSRVDINGNSKVDITITPDQQLSAYGIYTYDGPCYISDNSTVSIDISGGNPKDLVVGIYTDGLIDITGNVSLNVNVQVNTGAWGLNSRYAQVIIGDKGRELTGSVAVNVSGYPGYAIMAGSGQKSTTTNVKENGRIALQGSTEFIYHFGGNLWWGDSSNRRFWLVKMGAAPDNIDYRTWTYKCTLDVNNCIRYGKEYQYFELSALEVEVEPKDPYFRTGYEYGEKPELVRKVGDTGNPSMPIVFHNKDDESLTLVSATISSNPDNRFSLSGADAAGNVTIAPGTGNTGLTITGQIDPGDTNTYSCLILFNLRRDSDSFEFQVPMRVYLKAEPVKVELGAALSSTPSWDPTPEGNLSALGAKTVTITNTGNVELTNLAVNLDANSAFQIDSGLTVTSLARGASTTITVKPKADLPAGTYSDTLGISASTADGKQASASANLSLTVEPWLDAPSNLTYDLGTLVKGSEPFDAKYTIQNKLPKDVILTISTTDRGIDNLNDSGKINASGSYDITFQVDAYKLSVGDHTAEIKIVGTVDGHKMSTHTLTVKFKVADKLGFSAENYDIPAGVVGDSYTSEPLTAVGGEGQYSFSIEAPVDGLSLDSSNRLVYARSETAAATSTTIKVTDKGGRTATIVVNIGEVTMPDESNTSNTDDDSGETTVSKENNASNTGDNIREVTTSNENNVPRTGDDSGVMFWLIVMLISGMGAVLLAIQSHKRKQSH